MAGGLGDHLAFPLCLPNQHSLSKCPYAVHTQCTFDSLLPTYLSTVLYQMYLPFAPTSPFTFMANP